MKKILAAAITLLTATLAAQAVKMSDLKIYINPGHGGYDSDDRNIVIYPYSSHDTLGFWESKSNLYKGLFMYEILDSLGAKPYISRTTNTTDDDRDLYEIAYEANDLECDLFFAIHSNAGESVNYPLELYREDAVGTPRYEEAVTLSNIVWQQLYSNELPIWTRSTPYVSGDLTFYPQWGTQGLGVLRRLYVPGLLSEGEMHEHRPEAHRLMNMDYLWLEAWHFVASIMEYYDTEDKFVTGNVAGIVYDNHNTRIETLDLDSYTAHGRDANKPLNGASVLLKDSSGSVVQSRVTDNDNNGVFVFRSVSPGTYTLVTSMDGYYDRTDTVTVTANTVTYNDTPLLLKREFPLQVASYSPDTDELVSCATTVVITFNTDVDEETFEQAVSISPEVDGEWEYSQSYQVATFTPTVAFDTNTLYTVTVSTDARHPDTNYSDPYLQDTVRFQFETMDRNRLELIQNYPAEGDAVHYQSPRLEFRFDKTLNATDIYDLITITDSSGSELGISKRSSTYNKLSNDYGNVTLVLSSDLTIGQQYSVTLDGDIRDTEGIPLGDDVTINFTAEDQSVVYDGEIIEDFETADIFSGDDEASSGVSDTPQYYRYTSTHLFDDAAGRFYYSFSNSKDGVAVWSYNGDYKTAVYGATLGVYVYGDLNDHELSIGFTSGTDVKYVKICDVDFLGWKYFQIELTDLLEDFEYLLSNVKIEQKSSLYAMVGGVNIDNLTYNDSEVEGIDEVTAGDQVKIFPNPAQDNLFISGSGSNSTAEIYTITGSLALTASGQQVDVSGLSPGFYLLILHDNDRKYAYKFEKL